MTMFEVAQYLAAALVLFGGLFGLLAAVGVLRFPDLYTRMHAASKAGSLGTGLVFLAIALIAFDLPVVARSLFGVAFILLTAPVGAHLLARAAFKTGLRPGSITGTLDISNER